MKTKVTKIKQILFAIVMMMVIGQVTAQVQYFTHTVTMCSGAPTTIGVVVPSAVTWYWTPGAQQTSTISVNPPVGNSTYVEHSYAVSGLIQVDTFHVVTNATPVGTITSPQSICFGQNTWVVATGPAGCTFLWNTGSQNDSIPVNNAPVGIHNYSCLLTAINTCQSTLTTTVTVNPIPVITTVGCNTPLCVGATLYLNASATPSGCTYAWTGPNGFTSNQQNPTIANVTTANAGAYTCIATNNGCSSTPLSTTLVVNPIPTITVNGTTPICEGLTISLFSTTSGSSVHWTGPDGFNSNAPNPIIPNATTVQTGWYIGTATLSTCISVADSVWITVNAAPNACINGNTFLCTGQSTMLTAQGGGTYLWNTGQTTASITVSPTATTHYSVTVTGSNGCVATTGVDVMVSQPPQVTVTPMNPTVCEGTKVTFTATGAISFKWENGEIGPTHEVTPTYPSSTYTVIGTNAPGCDDTKSVTVNVNPIPLAAFSPDPPMLCQEWPPFYLKGGISTIPGEYCGGIVVGTCNTTGLVDPGMGPHETWPITYKVTDPTTGCINSVTQLVPVNPTPTVIFNPVLPAGTIYLDTPPFALIGGIPLGGKYSGNGVLENNNGTYSFTPKDAGPGLTAITYTYKDIYTCEDKKQATIFVVDGLGINQGYWKNTCVYPNPIIDIATIELDTEKPGYVEVTDMNGTIKLSQKIFSKKFGLDVSSLPGGLYFLRLISDHGAIQVMKIIKQ